MENWNMTNFFKCFVLVNVSGLYVTMYLTHYENKVVGLFCA